jgi:hypothetical protein
MKRGTLLPIVFAAAFSIATLPALAQHGHGGTGHPGGPPLFPHFIIKANRAAEKRKAAKCPNRSLTYVEEGKPEFAN